MRFCMMIDLIVNSFNSIINFFNNREIKKAREQEITPRLIISEPEENFNFRWVPLESIIPEQVFTSKKSGKRIEINYPIFHLANIGDGPAENIIIQWEIERGELNASVVECTILKNFGAYLYGNDLILPPLNKREGTLYMIDNISNAGRQKINYLLPSSSNEDSKELPLKHEIFSNLIFNILIIDRPKQPDLIKLPDINAKVTYSSIDGREFIKNFKIKSNILVVPDNSGGLRRSSPVAEEYFSSANIRGEIFFKVTEIPGLNSKKKALSSTKCMPGIIF